MDFADQILQHYGVKGMKWGVRRDDTGTVSTGEKGRVNKVKDRLKKEIDERTSTETTVRAKPGQIVRVVGGVKRLPHEDAVNARVAEQVAKRSTLDALSNRELQHLVNRMNLESQYRQLAVKETRASAGEKFANDIINSHGTAVLGKAGVKGATAKLVIDNALKVGSNKALQGGSSEKKKKDK
jgi:hypothetical protein